MYLFGILQYQSNPSLYAAGAIISLVGGVTSILIGVLFLVVTVLSFSPGEFPIAIILIAVSFFGGILSILGALMAIHDKKKLIGVKLAAIGAFISAVNIVTLVGVALMARSMNAEQK